MPGLIPPRLRERLKTLPGAVRAVRFVRSLIVPQERALRRIRARLPGQLLQPSMVTAPDRYPEFFAFVAGKLVEVEAPALLSFGCSSGEEVFSLRDVMPAAEILGIDINPLAIAACEARMAGLSPDPRIRIACQGSTAGIAAASFDAIFCMAVLRHGELQALRPERCDGVLPFAQAERTATDLARCLKPGGYLVIWNCHFRFADMAPAADFEVVLLSKEGRYANQPLYRSDICLLTAATCCEAIFRKR